MMILVELVQCQSSFSYPGCSVVSTLLRVCCAFSALTLLVGWQEGHPACKKTECLGAGVVICLERGADWHTAQLMPLPLTVSCFSKIQFGFTLLVPAYLGRPGKGPLNGGACVYEYVVGYQY